MTTTATEPAADDVRLPARVPIGGDARAAAGRRARAHYEGGASIRDCAVTLGRSFGFTRDVLLEAGTTLRSRGGGNRAK